MGRGRHTAFVKDKDGKEHHLDESETSCTSLDQTMPEAANSLFYQFQGN
ncbi:rCG36823 [Rattus norvegicus]|uniref:RCG36823 n=1 Tax=Rattus norvegicus TaxID=10116 RepID=A6HU13_RAT|nr:rCG36823 [Rattus norvegicus]